MNGHDLLSALSHIDEAYIAEAETKPIRHAAPARWLSLAACLGIVLSAALLWPRFQRDTTDDAASADGLASGATLAGMEDSIHAEIPMDEGNDMVDDLEVSSVILCIDTWAGDHFTASACENTNSDILPQGQTVTVWLEEPIRIGKEWRLPTEEDFPAGSRVVIQFHSFREIGGEISMILAGIQYADMEE